MTTSIQTDNPTTQDVATADDATKLVQSYQEKVGPAPTEGDTSTPSEPTATDDTGQPQPQTSPDIDKGKITRLEQDLAQQKQFLASLGIDPDSDAIAQYRNGLISKEQLLGISQPAQQTQQAKSITDRMAELEQKIARNGATQQDVLELTKLNREFAAQIQEQNQQSYLQNQYHQCENATLNVLDKDSRHSELPDDIKEIESQIFLGSTDYLLAKETQNNPNYLNPNGYKFYADKNLSRLNRLREHWIGVGKKMMQQNINPPKTPNPLTPTSTGPAVPSPPKINVDNLAQATKNYLNQQAQV